ncbi:MAG: hypothetical protein P9M07_01370 [Candidatus Aceula meridiana]|nr:hypothetical protein [Candidatus Aceula meridiana]
MKYTKYVIVLLSFAIFFTGCVTVKMPQYLQAENPYSKQFLADYDKTLDATFKVLKKFGWTVAKQSSPLAFEQETAVPDKDKKQVLIFTNVKQKAMFLSSRYMSLNIVLKENKQNTDVEIRYFSILSTAFKNFETYKNDKFVERIFKGIATELSGT